MSYYLTRTVELQAYGDRRETYGMLMPQFLATRYGGGINFEVHTNILLRVLGIWGTNVYGSTTGRGHGDAGTHRQDPGLRRRLLDDDLSQDRLDRDRARSPSLQSPLPELDRKAFRIHDGHSPSTSFSTDDAHPSAFFSRVLVLAAAARAAFAQDAPNEYPIGAKDLLEIRVLEIPDLNVERRVSDGGDDRASADRRVPGLGSDADGGAGEARNASSRKSTSTGPTSRSSSRSTRASPSRWWAPCTSRGP